MELFTLIRKKDISSNCYIKGRKVFIKQKELYNIKNIALFIDITINRCYNNLIKI